MSDALPDSLVVGEHEAILAQITANDPALGAAVRRMVELYDESDATVTRLRDALLLAKDAIHDLYGAGFDSTRQDIAVSALMRISEALDA